MKPTTPPWSDNGIRDSAHKAPLGRPLSQASELFVNLSIPQLIEQAIRRGEAGLTDQGALIAYTGERTGRSPQDRFIVRDALTAATVHWGKVNQPIDAQAFQRLHDRILAYFQNRPLFVLDAAAGAEPEHRLRLRLVAEKAWQTLFARHLFLRVPESELATFQPEWTILAAPGLQSDPAFDGTRSDVILAMDFTKKMILIAGTHYAGEIKKSIFSVLNYLLPARGVFPMHCSANIGVNGDTALYFGLSGTGKTTLSADPERRLIGDDEHAWSDRGVFNLEGGCYAKTIRLSQAGEPQIWAAIRFGSVLENVELDPKFRTPDYASERYTENTRVAYPIDYIPNCELSGQGSHPKHVFFLTCDAFGVLPPLSRLTPAQAMYHFLSGYTAKVAGTETGVTEPSATFSTCFAAPFLPRHPVEYATLLAKRLEHHHAHVWLVNTGWTGGPYGVGQRMSLQHTRALLHAVLDDKLQDVTFHTDPNFGVSVPSSCPDVPDNVLNPRSTWANPLDYDKQAARLAALFRQNFLQYANQAPPEVLAAAPSGG
ncbi:phosphoenolpyruvate carboxykinase (ATP) [Tuwongella immobilis]|uniref:Phosphoenolpyruvate carboxykinase (ATP) n=1 Tax=Tuwongella immobilis TaxID=692036 RepID=A0A6C2YQU0_9BACT|nr:phosphoenolpyruvate carboxykinase (ATP) [Tuwongella immobilis]VIP03252.1 phosphoenolpyruvate carboxykinase : Phosphoenolpyruvate carboxykinase [ATP] OS=uncultured bacterium GN=pckA PE=3 SV=1: PEPCK_ATP [Tuwongella immobilis]VTS03843.1 phosphoenolpyruvate carboxykinase : Phosphoenolpyruvate carboxykinase [ATP] OS=uncultured bacterium GN=pckA PE=3 SV=1: PEPCK_ATP [Tuwongella immobilis]